MAHPQPTLSDQASLARTAWRLREDVLTMIAKAGSGHPGGSLSAIDIITVLYLAVLRHDPRQPLWEGRDRFILSKGHACPALYAVLAECGYFERSLFDNFRQLGSPLQGHPELGRLAGVEASTGSLGQGLSIGLGMAEGARITGHDARVYVLTGDGELDEGQVWEAALYAGARQLSNLVAIVDVNGQQLDDTTERLMPLEPLAAKWEAFRWHVVSVDGHDMGALLAAFEAAKRVSDRPTVILAETIKGRGVSFMEDNLEWHGQAPNAQQLEQALAELRAHRASL